MVAKVYSPEEFKREVLEAKGSTIAMFYADWCPFCRRYLPIFEAHSSKGHMRFIGVNISDEDNPLWEDYDINVVPTLVSFKDGRVAKRVDGTLGVGLKEKHLEELLQASGPEA